ncbi:MAG: phosphoribosylformylglycinamidine synthase subunit PurQ [Geminicoccaceae bacterium]|nr:phosphoribosylformylglycinamidine synthase subunit PurQ [Geminicoccaceae bacterium]MCS7267258.1 phosphoribosylformylglycinamidine synthase subunit PurQ [Geminicoccaceae bacterium]MCX7629827.1 phosphoribosylformylglycinamidine synthase subunit PurQ [Geminicoccaceae bacterium]MDW8123962.1 phosphoribosylformylglycinamidine synthase subunit PurQ [Geminicoccaceae bacterium]MDW8340745.1 phosphoribosylformylglycinamidine synthase subunit PurQ [Geminicoccaceae bacterium]
MRAAVITFPGSNCDRDLVVAMETCFGRPVARVWHADTELPPVDLVGLPGGFSWGDYLRCGAIAARAPIMAAVRRHVARGGYVLGICNGFQILTEAGLLPGALVRNRDLKFVCRPVRLLVANRNSSFTSAYGSEPITLPVAHHDGNYVIDPDGLARLEDEGRIAFRYLDNPNGSMADIAGVLDRSGRVLGMMPHPERAVDPLLGSEDGKPLFASLLAAIGG